MPPYDIPLARPSITQAEIDAVVSVLKTPMLSLGPKLEAFEAAIAEFCGATEAVACANGTCALHLLVAAMDIGPGDEVITTPFSFVASSNCALMAGAKPVFADIDPDTWNIDVAAIEAAVTPHTRAVLPVDVFGTVPDMDAITAIARRHRLRVIEDSCEALGSRYKGRRAGSLADGGAFGFYPNKQITTGEGGMIVTNDAEVARLCRSMRNQGRDTYGGWLAHPRMGYNYRLSDLSCAMGLAQLQRIEQIIATRAKLMGWYRERLGDEPRVRFQKVLPEVDVSWFVCVVRLCDEFTRQQRDGILTDLRELGIGSSNYFAPIHLQPFYVDRFGYREGDFPNCEALAFRSVALPFHHQLTEKDVDVVCREFRRLLDVHGR
jgi:perosamine synthetase